ncbi:ead/Ea22-like family protein [Escherichia coli]|nr:ead/Ea22-like family protein [Escherichia coli]EFN4765849.1 ead/Ea22-like family protein [Escherichia coli]EKG2421370.1 ead/Ea22-like family protein [Escherichia coli]EKG4690710.1 ead/Ea22-like family protein [Escherichia coli]EKY9438944.1 ead/Ea22-like family protein [Escherichia coli]
MSEINYQALREAAERAIPAMERLLMLPADDDLLSEQELKDYGVDIDALNAFKFLTGPETVLALLDERERNQQYIKSRDQENEDIALTVGKLRVELEAAKSKLNEQREYYEGVIADGSKRIAELEKQCAEWERKALSNFEECAAMAERIEEMSKQSCEARERDLFESWVMHSICISKSTLEGLRTETGYRNATLSGTDFNRMWKQWKSIRAAGIRIKGE